MVKRVLIIDDDLGIRRIAAISIEAIAGWEVITAASGEAGIALAGEKQPDAILLDVMMPEMDGIATFQALQANSLTRDIPVILLTAKTAIGEPEAWEDLAIAGVISKPFKARELVDRIRELLDGVS